MHLICGLNGSCRLISYSKRVFTSLLTFGLSGSRSSSQSPGAQGPTQGSGGDGGRWGAAGPPGVSLNEQIVVALARLQEDMQSVLERLHTLEALTASQVSVLGKCSLFLSFFFILIIS